MNLCSGKKLFGVCLLLLATLLSASPTPKGIGLSVDDLLELNYPTEQLQGARILGGDGLTILFTGQYALSLETLDLESLAEQGFPGQLQDVRPWAVFLAGDDKACPFESRVCRDWARLRSVIREGIGVTEVLRLDWRKGEAIVLLGPSRGMVFFIDATRGDRLGVVRLAGTFWTPSSIKLLVEKRAR